MMEERDKWDIIVVMKMDRIHRNSKNFMIMMENLERWGKKFASMQESLDTSNAIGRFVVDIIQRIAQLESEQIGERTYMGMRQKAESGKGILGFDPPFGYKLESGSLMPDPNEADIVKRIFRWYLDGFTMESIATRLNEQGERTRRGNPWTKWSVSHILHNPIYAGFMKWDDLLIRGDHEPLVDPEDFNEVQRMIASRIKNPRHRKYLRIDRNMKQAVTCIQMESI